MKLIKFSSSKKTKKMETPKFKLYLNSEKFLQKVQKKVNDMYDVPTVEYVLNNYDIQKHMLTAEKLLGFLYRFTGVDWFKAETDIFQEIANNISKADSNTASYVIEAPVYPQEIFNFFKFSKQQRDENFSRINFFVRNAEHIAECEETNLNKIYKLSCLLLAFRNFDEITKYLKAIKEIKKIYDIPHTHNEYGYVNVVKDDDDKPLLPF